MNEILVLSEIIIAYIFMMVMIKLFDKEGLIIWIILTLICFILFNNNFITIFHFSINSGLIIYSTSFVAMNILIQKYGTEYCKRIIISGIVIITLVFLITFFITNMKNNGIFSDNNYFNSVFSITFRNYIATVLTFLVSAYINTMLYYSIRTSKNKIWISNLFTSIIVGFTDTILFSIMAFIGLIDGIELITLIMMGTIIKIITCLIGTVIIYIQNKVY